MSAGLSIEKGTGQAMEAHRDGVLQLPEGRVRMEAEALFGYGAAAASLRLLWRHQLLDVLLPQLAERFTKAKLPRCSCRCQIMLGSEDWLVKRGAPCHVCFESMHISGCVLGRM